MIIKSIRTKYGHKKLFNDIKELNEITHPFSIIVIKDLYNKFPNKYLLYYDSRWKCKLFINYPTKNDEFQNMESIRIHLSNELKIERDKINVNFCTSEIQKKFSQSDKITKCYEHRVYYVTIPFYEQIKENNFEIDGKHYYCMTILEMEEDKDIQEKNLDVVGLVKNSIA